jgi:hypothetical protein
LAWCMDDRKTMKIITNVDFSKQWAQCKMSQERKLSYEMAGSFSIKRLGDALKSSIKSILLKSTVN